LDLGRRQSTLVYSCYQAGGWDDASPERPTTILQQLELFCFCFHEGGHDPAAPLESQGSDENHLHQPCGKVGRIETLEEKNKTMRRRRNLIRLFTRTKDALFISTY
jgi:hypothetical protein